MCLYKVRKQRIVICYLQCTAKWQLTMKTPRDMLKYFNPQWNKRLCQRSWRNRQGLLNYEAASWKWPLTVVFNILDNYFNTFIKCDNAGLQNLSRKNFSLQLSKELDDAECQRLKKRVSRFAGVVDQHGDRLLIKTKQISLIY